MPNLAGLAINELLNTFLDVTVNPQRLPGMTVVNRGTSGQQQLRPDNQQPWNPGHAYINVESGNVRVKCDGNPPAPGQGTFYAAGSVIDWTSTLNDYQGMLKNFQVVADTGFTTARLSISFQN